MHDLPPVLANRIQRLKQNIANGESPLRWIDLFAAQAIAKHVESSAAFDRGMESIHQQLAEDQKQAISLTAFAFDLGLILSFAAGRGTIGLRVEDFPEFRFIACCAHEVLESVSAIEMASRQLLSVLKKESRRSPLVFQQGYWMFTRHAQLSNDVHQWIEKRLDTGIQLPTPENMVRLKEALRAMFGLSEYQTGGHEADQLDYQALAVSQSLLSSLVLISGGPGTGKTTTAARLTVLRLLKAFFEDADADAVRRPTWRVVCLAPTGKAAQRLVGSLRNQCEDIISALTLDAQVKRALRNALPEEGVTMHRYLIAHSVPMDELKSRVWLSDNEVLFGGSAMGETPVLVIVDESSMIDLALMQRFVSTLAKSTSVIFMGDPYQLPPVEVGQVFSDWVSRFEGLRMSQGQLDGLAKLTGYAAESLSLLNDEKADSKSGVERYNPLMNLVKSYRFDGALARLANIIRDDDYSQLEAFMSEQDDSVSVELSDDLQNSADVLLGQMKEAYRPYAEAARSKAPVGELQRLFDEYQVLCSSRLGPLGTDAMNSALERYMCGDRTPDGVGLFHGKAILVETNHPGLDLYNGDIGFAIEHSQGGFSFEFYRGDQIEPLVVPARKLSGYSPAYAITVHKSQGSEYRAVSVVVAPYAEELITRRLLYTAITRSKRSVNLFASTHSMLALLDNSN